LTLFIYMSAFLGRCCDFDYDFHVKPMCSLCCVKSVLICIYLRILVANMIFISHIR
jgi:hypothetical protein